jgi:hypothetical protein
VSVPEMGKTALDAVENGTGAAVVMRTRIVRRGARRRRAG